MDRDVLGNMWGSEGPYGMGTDDPAKARRRLKARHTKKELRGIAEREIGSQALSSLTDSKDSLAAAIVEARGRRSRGLDPDWPGAPDWGLEREL